MNLRAKAGVNAASVHLWRRRRQFARGEFVADECEAENATLKAVGEAREERRFLLILEKIELADDEVALFAGANELVEARLADALCRDWSP